MSEQPPPKPPSPTSNPQVIAAIIGGIVTLIAAALGVLPSLLNNNTAVPATAVVIVTATPSEIPSTATQITVTGQDVSVESTLPNVLPTPISLASSIPPTQASAANVVLMYDDVSFTVLNQDNRTLSFVGVTFSSTSGFWDARDWGPSLYNSLPSRNCLRLRDAASGQRQPPAACSNLYGLILVGTSAIFWRGVESFDVLRDGQVIATCHLTAEQCGIYIP